MLTIVDTTDPLLNTLVAVTLLVLQIWLIAKVIGRISVHDRVSGCLYGGLLLLETAATTYVIIPGMPALLVYGYLIAGACMVLAATIIDNVYLLRKAVFSIRYRLSPRTMREYDPWSERQRDERII